MATSKLVNHPALRIGEGMYFDSKTIISIYISKIKGGRSNKEVKRLSFGQILNLLNPWLRRREGATFKDSKYQLTLLYITIISTSVTLPITHTHIFM